MLKPKISLTWEKAKKTAEPSEPEMTFDDYVSVAEKAGDRLVKKFFLGVGITLAAFTALSVVGSMALVSYEHHLES